MIHNVALSSMWIARITHELVLRGCTPMDFALVTFFAGVRRRAGTRAARVVSSATMLGKGGKSQCGE